MADISYKRLKFSIAFQEYHPPLPLSFWMSEEFMKTYRRLTGTDVGLIYVVRNSELTGYMESDGSKRLAASLQRRLTRAWLEKELAKFGKHLAKLEKTVETARGRTYTRPQLARLFRTVLLELGSLYPYSNAFYLLSTEVEGKIIADLRKQFSETEANALLARLSRPAKPTFLAKYFADMERLAKKVREQHGQMDEKALIELFRRDKAFRRQLESLRDKYYCLTALNAGERTAESLLPDLAEKIARPTPPQSPVAVPKEIADDLRMLRIMIYFKDELSTYVVPYVQYGLKRQWDAAAAALKVSFEGLNQLLMSEIIDGLERPQNFQGLIEKRSQASFFFHAPFRPTRGLEGTKAKVEIASIENQAHQEDYSAIREVIGKTGSRGHAIGTVQKILSSDEIANFQEGNILVTVYTAPEFVPAMKKAAAIVTDTGGLTCHAAIVSRELGKPCIIGTKNATKVLKDGDLVEVDADAGVIRILK
jgi:phosphohistidine swiveling domain-containing protein